MKILIYGVNYAPELTGIGKYSGEMAVWLAEQGYEVRVVTAPPYYPEWKVDTAYANTYRKEVLDDVQVHRYPLYVPEKPSGLKRIIHLASFAFSSFPVMLRQVFWKPDVVMVIEPPLFCAPMAWLTARLSGGKCWLHIQDFEVDAAFDLGIIPFAWMKSTVLLVERWLTKRFDAVSTISQSMMIRSQDKGVKAPVFFPNWADLSNIQYDEVGRQSFRAEHYISDEKVLCLYSGNIAVKQGLNTVLEAANLLPSIQFMICGEGANKQNIEARSREMRLHNVMFFPLQALDRLAAMLRAADIHMVIQKTEAADLVLPSKLTNILAVGGVAIVTAKQDTELGQLGQGDSPCVYRCEPENKGSLVSAIQRLADDAELRVLIQHHALLYAKQYIDKQQVLAVLEPQLLEVKQ